MRRCRSASPSLRRIPIPRVNPTIMDLIREDLRSNNTKFSFGEIFGKACCPLQCFAEFTKFDITTARLAASGNYQMKRSYLLSVLLSSLRKSGGAQHFNLNWRGANLCTTAFCWIYKISGQTLSSLMQSVLNGETHAVHGNTFQLKTETKVSADKARVEYWLQEHSQFHPVTGKMFLDARLPARIIANQSGVSSVRRVRCIMRSKKGTVMRGKSSLMTRCSTCSKVKCYMRRGSLSKEDGRILMHSHMHDVKKEREIVNENYAKSLSDKEHLFLSIDDMSNQATKLPNLRDCRSKKISDCDLVRADLSAVVLGRKFGDSNYTVDLFVDVGNVYGAGANSVLNFLISSLKRMHRLPATLFIQVDGSRCNKNKVLFAFLSYMVERNLFSKITVMFLPVGHSHAFADRFFGVIRKKMNETDQFTPSELTSVMAECKGVRSIRHDRINFNFKKWIEDQIGKSMDGIFKNMCFELEHQGGKNIISCRPKASSSDGQVTKQIPSLTGEPKSNDTASLDNLIEVAEGELPENIVENWKGARDRVLKLPAPVRWNSVFSQLLSKKSERVCDEEELKTQDQEKLQTFMEATKKTRKRKSNNDDS